MYGMSEMTILYLRQLPPCFLIAELSVYNIIIVSNPVTYSIIVKLEKADAYNVAQKKSTRLSSLCGDRIDRRTEAGEQRRLDYMAGMVQTKPSRITAEGDSKPFAFGKV